MRYAIVAIVLAFSACASEPKVVAETGKAEQAQPRSPTTAVADALIAGDYVGVILRADEILAKQPRDAWVLYNKGAALAALGRTDEALTILRRAERAFPRTDVHGRSVAVWRRGLVLELAGRCNEASTEFSSYAALVRHADPTMGTQALAHMIFCAPERQPLALRPDPTVVAVQHASTAAVEALVHGDYESALARAEEGLAMKPGDAWLLYNKGTALAGMGRTDEALGVLVRAEWGFASDDLHGRSVAAYRRGIALELEGRCAEAGREFDHYAILVRDTDPLAAEHAMAHLKFCLAANQPAL
jgi:tetratricopeptide (TPR) repeat protein